MDHEHHSGKHPKYRGIRCRSGKWVSEIREPRKSNRIWLGTYPTAEMAAVAYDVAVHALRGADAVLNFPNAISSRPIPASASPSHIQAAAAEAAAAVACMQKEEGSHSSSSSSRQGVSGNSNAAESSYVDEEEIFDMPQLLISMAEGMMMSPPRLSPTTSDESLETSDHGDSLWSYH